MILRYVLCDDTGAELDHEYDSFDKARDAAIDQEGYAVIQRQYELSDSELTWTPCGSRTWPPSRKVTKKERRRNCVAIREIDEWHCPSCGLRWGLDEETPEAAACRPR